MTRHAPPRETAPVGFYPAPAVTLALFGEWMQDAGMLQASLAAFFRRRMDGDLAWLKRCADCSSPGKLVDLEIEMLSGLLVDYAGMGQRMLSLQRDALQRQWDLLGNAVHPAAH